MSLNIAASQVHLDSYGIQIQKGQLQKVKNRSAVSKHFDGKLSGGCVLEKCAQAKEINKTLHESKTTAQLLQCLF